jgi:DNA-binding transcriptional MerR regulator
MMRNVNKYFSALEVAELLGISKQTLLRYEKRTIFPKAKRSPINRRREYTSEDIAEFKKIMGRV